MKQMPDKYKKYLYKAYMDPVRDDGHILIVVPIIDNGARQTGEGTYIGSVGLNYSTIQRVPERNDNDLVQYIESYYKEVCDCGQLVEAYAKLKFGDEGDR